jgi:SAM-dependent methyltransferase
MKKATIDRLIALNNEFYSRHATTFSQTRQSAWPGWKTCLEHLIATPDFNHTRFTLADLACGNLRFPRFVHDSLPESAVEVIAVDNCPQMLTPMAGVSFHELDILQTVNSGGSLREQLTTDRVDLSVAFGFLHHVPTFELRRMILTELIDLTSPRGYVIVSLWGFLNDASLSKQALHTGTQAIKELGLTDLENNDCILGWQNQPQAYRYCHSFNDSEINELALACRNLACEVSRFHADGRSHNLNTYLILRVNDQPS